MNVSVCVYGPSPPPISSLSLPSSFLTLSHSLSHSRSLSLTHTSIYQPSAAPYVVCVSFSLFLSLSLSHTLSLSYTHILAVFRALYFVSLSLSLSLSLSAALSHTHTYKLAASRAPCSVSLSLSLSLTHPTLSLSSAD